MDIADGGSRIAGVLRGGVLLGWLRDIDQVVPNAAATRLGNLVGPDVEPAVHGSRIAVDDLALVPFRDREPERALARGGGAEDGHERSSNAIHC